ncbi:MAG: flagellar basal body rod protein FlgC [Actinobacteria bacterium]|nr:flagellar basal body rod protein FlgC [Actinomycetota bacterium]
MRHGPFASIDIANTGLGFNKYWMDTIAHNIANVNTTTKPGQEPFRARMVVSMPLATDTTGGGGVIVGDVVNQDGDPALAFDPDNPNADERGYVQLPVNDLTGQMGELILASRSYQMNMSVFKETRDALQVTTTLGRG